ncbi:hypothetical protein BOFE_02860 [Candidatus Borrelia fainii]|uniref:Uncharacterized protein n=1 Tax=Candidatus Borrelia fainii TaxID=2518322 RepID=A0ABM8DJJ8_9SPIR|nr:MATE family efflux transporter [Candidatus Borrelia fainii]BDU62746.1 hypothetical protein BOFE_02860 [Candidatus Borrelia fainii]
MSFVFSKEFIKLFIEKNESLNFGMDYLKIISVSYIFMFYSFLFTMGFKSVKDINILLVVTMFVVLMNIILNYILIFGFNMGIKRGCLCYFAC